jgi:hypothetical protein
MRYLIATLVAVFVVGTATAATSPWKLVGRVSSSGDLPSIYENWDVTNAHMFKLTVTVPQGAYIIWASDCKRGSAQAERKKHLPDVRGTRTWLFRPALARASCEVSVFIDTDDYTKSAHTIRARVYWR